MCRRISTTIPSTYQFSSEQLVISHLLSSPFVVGPSFRTIKNTHTTPKLSSTSVYALYRNSLLCNLNYFNECCLRSQDLDLHHRAHLNSFLTYCLPVAKAVYQPGSNLKNIIHKAYYNGFFPAAYNVIRLKQYIPLLFFVLVLIFSCIHHSYLALLLIPLILYLISTISVRLPLICRLVIVPSAFLYHLSHALGVFFGTLSRLNPYKA